MDFPGHFQRIFQQLNQQRLHRQLCDCVVLVGGQSFPAHRSILAACSSHFRALLSSAEGDESQGGGAGVGCGGGPGVMALDQEVVTPEAFSTLLDMIYTSTLTLGSSNVMDVLLAASHLHLNTVVKACKLHLSKCNFPTSPPKGWRSVQQQQNEASMSSQAVATAEAGCKQLMSVSPYHLELRLDIPFTAEELCGDETGAEVSQSGGVGEDGAETDGVSREQNTTLPAGKRRRSTFHEERLSGTKRSYYRERSPTVTRSTANGEERAEELSSSDSPEAPEGSLIQMVGSEEVEEKYEATKRESEEIELPSQSDGNPGGVGEGGREAHSESVVKVKVGEEKEEESEEEKMVFVEVKKENLSSSSWSTELDGVPDISPTPARDSSDRLGETADEEKLATAGPAESICGALGPQLCADPDTESGGEDPMGSGGLESLSELAFSCFLNPSSESVLGALEVEDSLASLAAAATTTMEALATTGDAGEQCQDVNASSTTSSDCSSSIVFPVSAVPFQQLLSTTQSQSFSDTLILRPAQSALGLLSGIKPGVSLQAALLSASSTGRNRGCATLGSSAFRRIAPKTAPGSEAGTDSDPSSSSGSSGEAAQRPALTRASEEVLSKCKKAAAEDHVLLVEGEKKYACRICCKTFMNLTDCKKHIRVHTGEKPYPCPKCGKRFSQSSHLYKHSKNTCLHWKGDQQPFLDSLL